MTPLQSCQGALHVALNAALDAVDTGALTPDLGQQVIDHCKEALAVAVLAELNEVSP